MNVKQSSNCRVAVIGTGQMGSALARAVRAGGYVVTAWNRTSAHAQHLLECGIDVAAELLEAVRQADLILVCVMDPASAATLLADEAVERALAGKTLVNYTTGTPTDADTMAQWAQNKGIEYLDGAVMCLPWEIGHPHALLVHAGSKKGFDRHQSTLKLLGGQSTFVDEVAGSASVIDSALLTFFYGSVMAMCQAGLMADAHGLSLPKLIPLIEQFVPTVIKMMQTTQRMAADCQYAGKDASLNLHYTNGLLTPFKLAKAAGVRTDLYKALDEMMRYAIEQGRGEEELPVVFDALKKAGSAA
ncbi:3-hydroxyisobutyrate dehydrogenase [Burkholderia sp. OK233]|nr:3-hydroxyisobutyrate dehydrogenase [Burkholderia sp. OK233]